MYKIKNKVLISSTDCNGLIFLIKYVGKGMVSTPQSAHYYEH